MKDGKMEAIEAVGKKFITALECEMKLMMEDVQFSDVEVLNILQVAIALSTSAMIASFARTLPNYKTRDRFIQNYRALVDECLDKEVMRNNIVTPQA